MTSAVSESSTTLNWRIHPFKRDWKVSGGLCLVLLLVPILTTAYVGSLALGIFFMVVMLVSLSRFFLPTEYQLNSDGVTIKSTFGTQQRNWAQFRSCYPDKNGVLISPFAGPSRLENFRGMYLIFEKNREEVLAFVRHHLATTTTKTPTRPSDSTLPKETRP